MKTASLVKDYAKLSDSVLEFRSQAVVTSLTDNPSFPATVPALADFSQVKKNYSDALATTITGDRTAIAIKNQARTVLVALMKQLALNIESLAPGDRAKLLSSGFELASDGENVPPLVAPTDFVLSDGVNLGEIKLSVRRVPTAVSYIHEYTDEPVTDASRWISKATTSREHLFTGLRSGSRIYARTAAIGRKGQEAYTPVMTRVVQ